MNDIKTTFKKYGYNFKLIEQKDFSDKITLAIYGAFSGGILSHYEVHKVKYKHNSFTKKMHWSNPSESKWGIDGFTYGNRGLIFAQAKVEQIRANLDHRSDQESTI